MLWEIRPSTLISTPCEATPSEVPASPGPNTSTAIARCFTISSTPTTMQKIDWRTGMRAYLAGIAGSLALLLAGCAGPAAMTHAGGEEEWVIEQPYHHPLAGVGGGAIVGSVLVKENREVPFASRTLVLVLQDQQLSLRKPEIGVARITPPRVPR